LTTIGKCQGKPEAVLLGGPPKLSEGEKTPGGGELASGGEKKNPHDYKKKMTKGDL